MTVAPASAGKGGVALAPAVRMAVSSMPRMFARVRLPSTAPAGNARVATFALTVSVLPPSMRPAIANDLPSVPFVAGWFAPPVSFTSCDESLTVAVKLPLTRPV